MIELEIRATAVFLQTFLLLDEKSTAAGICISGWKRGEKSPFVDSDFMSARLHSWWILPRRPGGTPRWTWDLLADNPVWTLLPHQNPEKRETCEIHKKAARRGFCFLTLNNRRAVATMCKNNTQVRQQLNTSLQCVRNKHRKWAHVLICRPYSVLVWETHQGHIRHGVDHHSLVLHCVLGDSPEAWF